MLSFVNWLTLSGAEQSGLRGPSTENQEAKQAAVLCIKVTFIMLQHMVTIFEVSTKSSFQLTYIVIIGHVFSLCCIGILSVDFLVCPSVVSRRLSTP